MMFKKLKGLLSLVICIAMLCTAMPITIFAAEGDVASVTFNGNTTYYTTIDDAWNAAVALDTTAENKATIQLLADCKAENTLTNTADYLVLDTNGKTLTTPDAIHPKNDVLCGISAEGGSLEIIGNGTITGISSESYDRGILRITGGEAYVNGVTIHNTGKNGSNAVLVNGGSFHLLDGYLISDNEYALDAMSGKVYLYSGKVEGTGRLAAAFSYYDSNVQICYSNKPLYFVDNDTNNWSAISSASMVKLEDNLVMDLEYSDNPDGSDSKILRNVTEIDTTANTDRNYLKIQTYKPSYMFSTNYNSQLLKKIKNDGVTDLTEDAFTAVHFVDLADYDLTDVTYSDYSSKSDGSVKAWVNGTELYIGGYGKIIAGRSLSCALREGKKIDSITGLDLLDTSKVTDMGYMFNYCGSESTVFTLDLGDNFDTSKVTDMTYMFLYCGQKSTKFALNLGKNFDTSKVTNMDSMFYGCGYSSPTFTLDLGDKFDTSKVTYMYQMFERCGYNSTAFTTLDLSTFNVQADTNLQRFAANIPVTKFIFGKGWRNATLNMQYSKFAESSSNIQTEIVGATKNVLSYDWASNNRTVTFTDNITYTITPVAEDGGTVSGGGEVADGESITLTAAANDGYIFDGWYDGDTKVCETEEFVIEDAADDKTYTAKFAIYYTISAEVGTDGGGTVSGGGKAAEGGSITLTATANDGYTFDGWYDDETKVCDTAEFVVDNVTADKTYTAKFTKNVVYYTISAEVGTDGGGTVSGGGKAAEGGSITLTATANDGYIFDGWYDGETKVCDTAEFTVENVTADKTYTAKFTKNVSRLFDTSKDSTLLGKIKSDGITEVGASAITGVHFVNLADYDLTNITYSDYSADGDESVKAWMDDTELYIGGYGKITAGESLACAFAGGNGIDSITGLEMLDTSNTKNMSFMFSMCGSQSGKFTLDLGDSFDTSNVTDMSGMFNKCGCYTYAINKVFTLDLGDSFDTSNVTDMSYMFNGCGRYSDVFTLDLGDKFDTSNVTTMKRMFYWCGYNSDVFTLDLGDKFDTSNVTDMVAMFYNCGYISKVFTLDLGDKFNTSKVTDMSYMFDWCGYYSTVFTLDLGNKFDTSNVTNMQHMFEGCGYSSTVFTLDLGDKFDTSNVTSMKYMFNGCGYKSKVFTLNLGGMFDTSKVPDMSYMFDGCGSCSTVFTLDLGDKFNTSNVTNMSHMFEWCGTLTLDLGDRFDTSKVTDMSYMFYYCDGRSAFTLNLGDKFDTSNVTNMSYMFYYCGCYSTVFTLDLGDKFDTSKVTDMSYMFYRCGNKSGTFTTLDLSLFTINAGTDITKFAQYTPATTFIFGEGWANATLPTAGSETGAFYVDKQTDTEVVGATPNLIAYDWAGDNRAVSGLQPKTYTVTATAEIGGTVSGGGEAAEGGSVTLTATANDGYTFDGWYDGETKVCDTAEFTVENVTEDKTYTAKFIKTVSRLFSTSDFTTLLDKIKTDGITTYKCDQITAVHFVDLANYDLTDIKYSDYSANKDGSVKAWMDGTELYIGGYGKIIAGERLRSAFWHGDLIKSITGLEMLDTSNVTDMSFMFYACGWGADVFSLNLGDTFNTSNVTDMSYMFYYCGYNCKAFTLDLGDNFDTSKVTNMKWMFFRCGDSSKTFTTLDLSTFKVSADTDISNMASQIPVTTFIFGDGWASAKLPTAGSSSGAFYAESETGTTIVCATENLLNYKWASDNRTVTFTDKSSFIITANAQTGGTVSSGGEVPAGGSITLIATADDGYTFDGWYDGDTKVCDTAEFTVKNVAADKTYTAKFTKNQVIEPEPEPENPDIPYLKWDGTTLTLVKRADASCRVGIVYVGGATFDADNINWDRLVSAGKEYANLNSSVGYAVYNNFTKRTPGTRGNYVAFVKYTKEDGTTTADYITFNVKNAVSFETPALSYNAKTKTLKMTGNVSSTIGVAYIGNAEISTKDVTWNDFIKAGKKYADINGSSGYTKVLNTLDYANALDTNGNYVVFIKYFDENLNKTIAKYYTFNVADFDSRPTDAPFAIAEESKITLAANGFDVVKVTIVYIGTDDMYISNWNEFSAAAAKFSDINGKALNQQYTNPKDGSVWKQNTAGWYGVYIRYIKDDKICNSYYTLELN